VAKRKKGKITTDESDSLNLTASVYAPNRAHTEALELDSVWAVAPALG
jgi:hypothetical protein